MRNRNAHANDLISL